MRVSLWIATLLTCTDAFTVKSGFVSTQRVVHKKFEQTPSRTSLFAGVDWDEDSKAEFFPFLSSSPVVDTTKTISAATGLWALSATGADAAGPDWGIFEGRTGSLLHPIVMAGLLGLSLSAGLLGLQWRRQRTIGDEISALKKTLPNLNGASSVSDAIATAKAAESVDTALVNSLEVALPIESQISELQEERKRISANSPRDKHFSQGALLAFIGTAFAIEGPLNTYARAGKLFPGPHLYAGAGLVVLWALAASCVPAMQKGNDTARAIHIGANSIGIGLFGWQVVSGIPILLKVVELTKWP